MRWWEVEGAFAPSVASQSQVRYDVAHFPLPAVDSGSLAGHSTMFARFFSTVEVDKVADTVVGVLRRSLPAAAVNGNSKASERTREMSANKVQKCIDQVAASTRLNIYQKAKLGTRLEAAMQAAGYEAAFSKTFAHEVVHVLAVATARKRP